MELSFNVNFNACCESFSGSYFVNYHKFDKNQRIYSISFHRNYSFRPGSVGSSQFLKDTMKKLREKNVFKCSCYLNYTGFSEITQSKRFNI